MLLVSNGSLAQCAVAGQNLCVLCASLAYETRFLVLYNH